MKILIVPYYFAPASGPRSIRWSNIARYMAERGHDVTVMAGHFTSRTLGLDQSLCEIAAHPRITANRIPLAHQGPTPWRDIIWALRVARHVRLQSAEYDVLISSALPIASHIAAWLIMERRQIPVWIADYGDPWSVSRMRPGSAARKWLERRVEQTLLRHVTALTITTKHSTGLFRRLYSGRIELIPQGASLFHVSADWSTQRKPTDTSPVSFLYAGGFYRKWREPTELFQAFRNVDKVRLVVCGSHQVDAAGMRNGAPNIELLDLLELRDVVELQQQSDVLVVLSSRHSDQIPGKVYEYMATQRPVLYITNNQKDEVATLLTQRNRGHVCAFNAESIQAAIEMVRDTVQRGTNASSQPQKDVGFDVRATAFLDLIDTLRKERTKSGPE